MPFSKDPLGLRLSIRLNPKASRDEVSGLHAAADGTTFLRAYVRAAPEKGKANKALIKLLAQETGLAPSRLSVIAGAHHRNKVILIKGEPEALEAMIQTWLQELK